MGTSLSVQATCRPSTLLQTMLALYFNTLYKAMLALYFNTLYKAMLALYFTPFTRPYWHYTLTPFTRPYWHYTLTPFTRPCWHYTLTHAAMLSNTYNLPWFYIYASGISYLVAKLFTHWALVRSCWLSDYTPGEWWSQYTQKAAFNDIHEGSIIRQCWVKALNIELAIACLYKAVMRFMSSRNAVTHNDIHGLVTA